MDFKPILSTVILVSYTLFTGSAHAESQVYKWSDDKGVIHFSSIPPHPGAKPAQLARIVRQKMNIPKVQAQSCESHGGINCQAGADSDGSVICYDGFSNAASPYRLSCKATKLEIGDISELAADGSFSIYIRNAKSVAANKVKVAIKTKGNDAVTLTGPTEIDALGMGEYRFLPSSTTAPILQKPTPNQIDISCLNCE